MQIEKLKEMDANLNSDNNPEDWTEDDVNKLDIHLWAQTRKTLKSVIETKKYKDIELEKGDLSIASAIVELRNHLQRNIFALEKRFKDDFQNELVDEIKNVFDFDYMIELQESLNDETMSSQEVDDKVQSHGNEYLRHMMTKQSKENPPSQNKVEKVVLQYNAVKKNSF